MSYVVRLPGLGMQTDRATLVEWTVELGDTVTEGDSIAIIETEKATADIEAKEDGVIQKRYVAAGETAKPNNPLAIIADEGEDIADLEAIVEGDDADHAHPETANVEGSPETAESARSSPATDADVSELVTPRAIRRAEELDIDLSIVAGSGPGGEVFAADVEAAVSAGGDVGTVAEKPSRTLLEERELNGMRQAIADRLGRSDREAIHVTEHRTADAETLLTARDAASRALDVDISLTDLLLAALSATLETHPEFNATFEDGRHRIYEEHNVGLAVDVDDGLVTPVLDAVGKRTLADVSTARRELVDRVLEGDYEMADLQGGTFTVTNLGELGVESFTPIINPPQVAILGVGEVTEKAVRGDDDSVILRDHLPIDLSFDHRVVDGADAARFLATIVDYIENPWPLLPDAVDDAPGPGETVLPNRQVTARTEGGFDGTVTAGSTQWEYDEPEELGGGSSAPTPVDMYLGSLGACLSASIGFQAAKRDETFEEVTVDVAGTPVHGPLESIDVTVTVEAPDADDETLDRIVERGEQGCFVARLLKEDFPLSLTWTRAAPDNAD